MVSFLHSFMENISDLTECNVLFNNEHLIWIWFFLLIDTKFDLKITYRILNLENHQVYYWKSTKCCYFQKRFQYHIVFQYQPKIIRVIIEKTYYLIIYSCYIFPVIDLNEHFNTILYLLSNFSNVYAWFRPRAVICIICRKIFYYCLGYWSWWKIWFYPPVQSKTPF